VTPTCRTGACAWQATSPVSAPLCWIDPGFLVGPALILITLPLVFGRSRHLALKRYFRERLVAAALLWAAGLVALIVRVSGLDSSYAIEAGTYVSPGLLLTGLLSTLAMWPGDLPIMQVNRKGTRASLRLLQHGENVP